MLDEGKDLVTLSPEVCGDRPAGGTKHSRSAVIERVLRRYLREKARAATQAETLILLNDAADSLIWKLHMFHIKLATVTR